MFRSLRWRSTSGFVHSTKGLIFHRSNCLSLCTRSRLARPGDWALRIPVTHAPAPSRARRSGSVFRSRQHALGSRRQSSGPSRASCSPSGRARQASISISKVCSSCAQMAYVSSKSSPVSNVKKRGCGRSSTAREINTDVSFCSEQAMANPSPNATEARRRVSEAEQRSTSALQIALSTLPVPPLTTMSPSEANNVACSTPGGNG